MYTMSAKAKADYLDKAACDAIDKDQGRIRLQNSAVEAVVVLLSCYVIGNKAAEVLEPFIKKTGRGRMLKAHMGGISKQIDQLIEGVSVSQLKTIRANTHQVSMTISAHPFETYANISHTHLLALTSQALEACGMFCDKNRTESRRCPVRKALEQIPGVLKDKLDCDPDKCPYAGMRLEIEGVSDDA